MSMYILFSYTYFLLVYTYMYIHIHEHRSYTLCANNLRYKTNTKHRTKQSFFAIESHVIQATASHEILKLIYSVYFQIKL